MRILKEWRKIDNQRGYMNMTTGQNVVVVKKPYGEHYLVMLFPFIGTKVEQGKKISPEYAAESKAETFALDWMDKHPRGGGKLLNSIRMEVTGVEQERQTGWKGNRQAKRSSNEKDAGRKEAKEKVNST